MAFKPVVVVTVSGGVANEEINTGATLLVVDWDSLKQETPDVIEAMIERVGKEVPNEEKAKFDILKNLEDCLETAKEMAAENKA